jgi:hypothetical protein
MSCPVLATRGIISDDKAAVSTEDPLSRWAGRSGGETNEALFNGAVLNGIQEVG